MLFGLEALMVKDEPEQMVWVVGDAVIEGVGYTVIVKRTGLPEQPFRDGVTEMVATWFVAPELTAVKGLILPFPLAARPMPVLLLFQLKVVPGKLPVKMTWVVEDPLQTVWLSGVVMEGELFTVATTAVLEPGVQPLALASA
jgi:hypothetical protein